MFSFDVNDDPGCQWNDNKDENDSKFTDDSKLLRKQLKESYVIANSKENLILFESRSTHHSSFSATETNHFRIFLKCMRNSLGRLTLAKQSGLFSLQWFRKCLPFFSWCWLWLRVLLPVMLLFITFTFACRDLSRENNEHRGLVRQNAKENQVCFFIINCAPNCLPYVISYVMSPAVLTVLVSSSADNTCLQQC